MSNLMLGHVAVNVMRLLFLVNTANHLYRYSTRFANYNVHLFLGDVRETTITVT